MAMFGTTERSVVIFDPQTLLPLQTVVLTRSSFSNGRAEKWDRGKQLLFPVHLRKDVFEFVFGTSDGRLADIEAEIKKDQFTVTSFAECECAPHSTLEPWKICCRWQQRGFRSLIVCSSTWEDRIGVCP
jgi:hypothetical protein